MADDIRIKDLQSTASYMESDDYLPIDSLALGNRKIPFTGLMDSEDDRLPTTDKTPRGAITEHEEDISEIKQSLSKLTLSKVVNGTTDTNSNLNLNLSSNDYVVKSVYLSNRIAIPFIYNDNWYCSVRQTDSSMSPVANGAVNGYAYYEEK